MRRKAAVAGQFYHSDRERLTKEVNKYILTNIPKEKVIAALCPHAGLVYSGSVAGAVYSHIDMPETFILIGPNHTGIGARVSLMAQGDWEIPIGVMPIDQRLARKILSESDLITPDTQAHLFEHSLEVQLPFIAYLSAGAKIVPITVMHATLEECKLMGEAIARSISQAGYPVVIIASSDMSHYVSDDVARKKDKMAINRLLQLDPEGLYNTVNSERISMCGYIPATIMLYAAKALNAKEARLIKYATSGDVSGDYDYVVGYAGIIIK
jgi:AmmeMemoRadiSam system protein B